LGTRTRLIGEWSDVASLFNACDVVCSSATTDSARLALAMAMSCGVLCVGTGVGAQGEVLGNFGIAVEAGSPAGLVRGLTRALELPFDRKAFVIHESRKHIWLNFNIARSIEKLHELYVELAPNVALGAKPATSAASLPPELAVFVPPKAPVVEAAPAPPEAPPVKTAPVREAPKPPDTIDFVPSTPGELATSAPAMPAAAVSTPSVEGGEWSLDDALSTQRIAAFKPDKTVEPVDDSMEWSAADSELISSMMVTVDPSEIKPVVVERPRPKPAVAAVSFADAEAAEAKARAKRLMDARRAELQNTTATAHAKPAAAPTKIAKG